MCKEKARDVAFLIWRKLASWQKASEYNSYIEFKKMN